MKKDGQNRRLTGKCSKMTKEDIYYYCTTCKHVHLRNSEIGKLHIGNSFKIQKQKIEMEDANKGL